MVKVVLQITAEVLICMALPQRDNEHLDKCFYPAAQDKLKVSMVMLVLQSTAEVHIMKLALHMTTEVNVLTQVLQSTVIVSR